MQYPPDHGLPLVQLKERRREMVVALQKRGYIGDEELKQLAAMQQAILAIEDVISDLDCEQDDESTAVTADRHVH